MPKPTGKIRKKHTFKKLEVEICPKCGRCYNQAEIKEFKTLWNHYRFCLDEPDGEPLKMKIKYQTLTFGDELETCYYFDVDD